MKKIFLSILVAVGAFFGASNAKAQIAVNFSTAEMQPEFAAMAQQVMDMQMTDPDGANKAFSKLFGKVKKNKEQAVAVGKYFLDRNVYPCAKQLANAAYTVDPHYVPGLKLSVGVCLLRKNYGEAGAKLDEILNTDPNDIEALRLSARVYKYVNPYAAKDILNQIIEKEPGNLDAYKQLGDIAYQLEEYKDAVEAYKKFFTPDAKLEIADLRSGENYLLSLMNQQDVYTMKDVANQLLPLDANDLVVRRMLFFGDMETFDYANASEHIKYLTEKQYDDSLYVYLDYVYAANYATEVIEDVPAAIEYYKKGLEIAPDKVGGYKSLADLYRKNKQAAEGLPYYVKYVELKGEKADEFDKLGLGNYYTAVKDAVPAKEDGSVDEEARLAIIEKGDPYFQAYMDAQPDKYQGPYYRAKLWVRDGGKAEAEPKKYYEQTLDIINKMSAEDAASAVSYKKVALTYLMIYYLKTDDTDQCKNYMNQILEIDPNDALANRIKAAL